MTVKETFKQIEEGDIVRVSYGGLTTEVEVWLVTGADEGKVVSLDISQTNPRLVQKRGTVYVEKRPLGRPREWSDYVKIEKLEIIEKNN